MTSTSPLNVAGPSFQTKSISPVPKAQRWTGRILTAIPVLFLLMDGIMKLVQPAVVVEGTIQLGYPASVITGLGLALLSCVLLHVIPRTSVFGAILLTGYLGGAAATHVRVGNPLFSHVLFPVYLAVFIWAGLVLREPGLRGFLPVKR